MSRRERLNVVANWVQTLQFRGEVYSLWLLGVAAHVKGGDTDWISRSDNPVLLLVVKHPGEHAVQVLWCVDAIILVLCDLSGEFLLLPLRLTYQWDDDLTVGVSLEWVWLAQVVLTQDLVVVDLTVDGQSNRVVLVGKRLRARV